MKKVKKFAMGGGMPKPAGLSMAKPAANPAVQKFTGPMSSGPRFNNPNPGVTKFAGPMSTGPRFDKPNPGVQKFAGPMSTGPKMNKGGSVSASNRADGCAVRGKTKGKMV